MHRWPCPPGRARAAPPAVFVFASGVGVGVGVGGKERGMGTPVDYNLMVLFFFLQTRKKSWAISPVAFQIPMVLLIVESR